MTQGEVTKPTLGQGFVILHTPSFLAARLLSRTNLLYPKAKCILTHSNYSRHCVSCRDALMNCRRHRECWNICGQREILHSESTFVNHSHQIQVPQHSCSSPECPKTQTAHVGASASGQLRAKAQTAPSNTSLSSIQPLPCRFAQLLENPSTGGEQRTERGCSS